MCDYGNVSGMTITKKHPLDDWRQLHGWTQTKLAAALQVTPATISKVFGGSQAGLSKRASLRAFVLTDGAVDLATLLLGPDIDGRRSVKR